MSAVFITNHNENIYNIDISDGTSKCAADKQIVHHKRIVKYVTKYHQNIKTRRLHGRQQHATMGVAEIPPPLPGNYLRKHTGHVSYTQNKPEFIERSTRKAHVNHVPTREEIEELNRKREEYRRKQTNRNHIVENVKKIKVMKVKTKQQNYIVIDQYGTRKRATEAIFLKSKVFGKIPKYLKTFLEYQKKSIEDVKKAKEEAAKATKCKQITREERDKLLQGLKHNWAELQKEFQSLPILTDTIPKRNRKVKLENDLKQLEKDIDLIEHHPYIYVYDEQ